MPFRACRGFIKVYGVFKGFLREFIGFDIRRCMIFVGIGTKVPVEDFRSSRV